MTKLKKITLPASAILLFFGFFAQGQVNNLDKRQIREDIDYMVKALEETSVNPFSNISKTKFLRRIHHAEIRLLHQQNVNITDLYKYLQPVIVQLEDGHTELYIGSYMEQTDYLVFPFDVDIDKDGLLITGIHPGYENVISSSTIGKKINAINGFSSHKILHILNTYNSGENVNSRLSLSKYYLVYFFNLFFKKGNHLRIAFNDKTNLDIRLDKKSAIKESTGKRVEQKSYFYTIEPDKRYAILAFNNFSNLKRFKAFLAGMFAELKNKDIANLIIDVRDNGGGNSDLGDELLKYLSPVPFSQYEKTLMKYSEISKTAFKTYFSPDSKELQEYLGKKDGTTDTIDKSNHPIAPYPVGKRYTGKVFLLTSGRTFSSAADFAHAFKHYKIGSIVGTETGGFVIAPGEVVGTKLPNSRLEFNISSSKDFDIGTGSKDWHGVIPDYETDADKALDYTVSRLIKYG